MSKLAKHAMEPEKSSSCYIQTCWNDAVVLYTFSGLLLGKFQSSPWHIVLWPVHQPRSGRRGADGEPMRRAFAKALAASALPTLNFASQSPMESFRLPFKKS
jgi:hypothetical protein